MNRIGVNYVHDSYGARYYDLILIVSVDSSNKRYIFDAFASRIDLTMVELDAIAIIIGNAAIVAEFPRIGLGCVCVI